MFSTADYCCDFAFTSVLVRLDQSGSSQLLRVRNTIVLIMKFLARDLSVYS